MGKKTGFTLKILAASLFTMLVVVFLFTDSVGLTSFGGDTVDTSSLEDGVYTGSGTGFNGPIEVEVTVEGGEITNVAVLSHSESEGISDPAIEGIPADIVANNSTEVEVVSGATFTSDGIKAAVNDALNGEPGEGSVAVDPAGDEEDEEDAAEEIEASDAQYPDGTYEATVDGHNGPLTVVVTVEGNVITAVEVTEHEETEGLADPALEDVTAAIVARNATDVDVVSGATVTSEAIISAVEKALGMGPKVKAAAYEDGVYEATVDGRNAPLTVVVTVEGNVITAVEVTEHEETEGLTDSALTDVPAAIVENDATDVEVVSGATLTSNAIMAAVDEALLAGATAYQVTVDGHNGPLTVVVELTDGTVSSVEVTEHEETEGLADPALADVPAAIVEANSTDVEVVSGVTVSSQAIIDAVDFILEAVNE